MRVLHINAGNLYGGVETLLVTLARYRDLCPAMEPSFALCFEGRFSQELAAADVPVHFLGEVKTKKFWSVFQARQELRRVLRRNTFDAVITHMPWSHAIFGPEVNRADIPLLNWVHGIPSGRHWLERWASRTPPDLTICNSQFTASHVSHLFKTARNKVVHLPVAVSRNKRSDRSALREQLGANDDTVVILQASRMEAWKGHELHLRALAKLRDVPNWSCWMAGGAQRPAERNYMARLKKQASDLGITDQVRFLGHRSDIRELMAAADVFCQPNVGPEPFGIVFIEALYAGLPVVSSRMGGVMEIIDGAGGILVEPGDPGALAECLRRLIGSPQERHALGAMGPLRASILCDPAIQMNKLASVIETCAVGRTAIPSTMMVRRAG